MEKLHRGTVKTNRVFTMAHRVIPDWSMFSQETMRLKFAVYLVVLPPPDLQGQVQPPGGKYAAPFPMPHFSRVQPTQFFV